NCPQPRRHEKLAANIGKGVDHPLVGDLVRLELALDHIDASRVVAGHHTTAKRNASPAATSRLLGYIGLSRQSQLPTAHGAQHLRLLDRSIRLRYRGGAPAGRAAGAPAIRPRSDLRSDGASLVRSRRGVRGQNAARSFADEAASTSAT